MLASLMGLDEGITNREILAKGDVPYYTYAEGSIRALKAMLTFTHWVKTVSYTHLTLPTICSV